jgi:hypothetical protein
LHETFLTFFGASATFVAQSFSVEVSDSLTDEPVGQEIAGKQFVYQHLRKKVTTRPGVNGYMIE